MAVFESKTSWLAATLVVAACGTPRPQEPVFGREPTPTTTAPPPEAPPAQAPAPSAEVAAPEQSEKGAKVAPIPDGEIVAELRAAGERQLELADMARRKADSEEVRGYAAMVLTQSTSGLGHLRTIEGQGGIAPIPSAASSTIVAGGVSALDELRGLSGDAFDRRYLDLEATQTEQLLRDIDMRLLPAAKDPELKAVVAETRRTVAGYLERAKALASEM